MLSASPRVHTTAATRLLAFSVYRVYNVQFLWVRFVLVHSQALHSNVIASYPDVLSWLLRYSQFSNIIITMYGLILYAATAVKNEHISSLAVLIGCSVFSPPLICISKSIL